MREQARAQAVVDIVIVVRDFVGEIRQLRFERRLRRFTKRSPTSPSMRAFLSAQCFRMPSRVSKHRLRPSNAA